MKQSIPHRPAVELADEQERGLMDPGTWEWADVEELPGNRDAVLELVIPFDREQVTALAAIAMRDQANPIDLVRRYVVERLACEQIADPPLDQVIDTA